jgi:hypothetical protein
MFSQKNGTELLTIAVVIVIVLGLGISFFFILVERESYSSIYIIPDSIVQDKDAGIVFYTYRVTSSETVPMDYALNIYLDGTLIEAKQFSLNIGELLDERKRIDLPADIKYPAKISLNLSTRTSFEEVHFWLRE